MTERITIDAVNRRALNVNRRLIGTGRAVVAQSRNGYVALDEYEVYNEPGMAGGRYGALIRTITVGTKREIAEYLNAMMVGIDLSRSNHA